MIVKIKIDIVPLILDGFSVSNTSCYSVGNVLEKIATQKKIGLSIKIGKKRKIISGKIIYLGYSSSRNSSGTCEYKFVPNNLEKLNKILG
jgi:hypothetical protein